MNEERGFTLGFTALSGSGKTTIAEIVERDLRERERREEGLVRVLLRGIHPTRRRSDPYEAPAAPDLVLKTEEETPEESARKVIEKLEFFGYLWPREAKVTEYNWGSR